MQKSIAAKEESLKRDLECTLEQQMQAWRELQAEKKRKKHEMQEKVEMQRKRKCLGDASQVLLSLNSKPKR